MKKFFVLFMLVGSVAFGAEVSKYEKVSDEQVKLTYVAVVETKTIATLKEEKAQLEVEVAKVQNVQDAHNAGWNAEKARLAGLISAVDKKIAEATKLGVKEVVAKASPVEAIEK